MREIYTVQDGYGIQCFSTWKALRKWLFVLRGRFVYEPDTWRLGYQNGLFFDTDNPTTNGAHEHGTPATARRVKQVLDGGFQCTLVDGADRHPHHIVITQVPLYTANDMEAHWHYLQQNILDNSPQTVEAE